MPLSWSNSPQLFLRPSHTRIAFRYGAACLTECPQALLRVQLQVDGRLAVGFSGDCLPPSWFDKNPAKDFDQQIRDMLASIDTAQQLFADAFATEREFFAGWWQVQQAAEAVNSAETVPLLQSFGRSLVERAMIDALCRAWGQPFHQVVTSNRLGLRPEVVHSCLQDASPGDWLPAKPATEIWVRHTVGLGDPLSETDVADDEWLRDGRPQTLEQYIQTSGIRYLKVKLAAQPDDDLERLLTIAGMLESRRDRDYYVTLDGNEQYLSVTPLLDFAETVRAHPRLRTFWDQVLVIEQPLRRDVALDPQQADGVRQLSELKPLIIDESDDSLHAFANAAQLGYRGVSSKACKGPIKSVLNAGLVATWNQTNPGRYVMTGEDLCCVGVAPVQTDLCLAATLGLKHVERNGHHFHAGLGYLPADQQQAALEAHPDFYHSIDGTVSPRLENGRFQIASLHRAGFGFAATAISCEGWQERPLMHADRR